MRFRIWFLLLFIILLYTVPMPFFTKSMCTIHEEGAEIDNSLRIGFMSFSDGVRLIWDSDCVSTFMWANIPIFLLAPVFLWIIANYLMKLLTVKGRVRPQIVSFFEFNIWKALLSIPFILIFFNLAHVFGLWLFTSSEIPVMIVLGVMPLIIISYPFACAFYLLVMSFRR